MIHIFLNLMKIIYDQVILITYIRVIFFFLGREVDAILLNPKINLITPTAHKILFILLVQVNSILQGMDPIQ